MNWYDRPEIKEIIKEVAEDFKITPEQVSGVLSCLFDNIKIQARMQNTMFFKIPGFGTLCMRGYEKLRKVTRSNTHPEVSRPSSVEPSIFINGGQP